MKYLAILKDSFREAVDAKVFFVLVGLSGLLILLAVTTSFTPQPADEGLQTLVRQFEDLSMRFMGMKSEGAVSYQVNDIDNLNAGGKPWDAEYQFNLLVANQ